MENQKEYLEKLKKEYTKKDTGKLDKLKALDRKVKTAPMVFAYTFGSIVALIFGLGMCLAMKVIGGTNAWFVVGIVIGVIGLALMSVTAPIYYKMLNKRKAKYSEQILKLSNELLNEEEN